MRSGQWNAVFCGWRNSFPFSSKRRAPFVQEQTARLTFTNENAVLSALFKVSVAPVYRHQMSAPKNQSAMKVLIFAHVPPPHHGQSYMVQLMLNGFGGDCRKNPGAVRQSPHQIECYHVNARVSKKLADIGDMRFGKIFLMLGYCAQAIWCRYRYGVKNFYFIPAPGKSSALYRDWLVMFVCRRFFERLILHWHAAGLAKWLETAVQIRWRAITYRALKTADLCVVLSNYNRADAEKLLPQRIKIVSNGILDPCPDFDRELLPLRKLRRELRAKLLSGQNPTDHEFAQAGGDPRVCSVLYLAHCMREKGLFDAIAGVRLANQKLAAQSSPIRMQLNVAGNFVAAKEKAEFDQLCAGADSGHCTRYLGFVGGETKMKMLHDADLFCFPTFYQNENQPVNLIEAMAFGLPVVTTRWRSLPEMFPPNYPGLVEIHSPEKIADALIHLITSEAGDDLRKIFLRNFTLESYLAGLARAFRSIETAVVEPATPVLQPQSSP
jgi:glycosyltransferase involved in cell wall biosynthesis